MKRATLSYIPFFFALLLLAGCSESLDALEREPYLEGTLTQIGTDSRGMVRYLVEEDSTVNDPLEKGGTKVWFYLDEDSELLARRAGGSLDPVESSSLERGVAVSGWARGAVADSYPQQAVAERLVIEK